MTEANSTEKEKQPQEQRHICAVDQRVHRSKVSKITRLGSRNTGPEVNSAALYTYNFAESINLMSVCLSYAFESVLPR